MNWVKSHQRSAWICGLTLLFPAMPYLDVLLGVWAMGREYQADIDRQHPRIARMRGLIEHEDQLRESAGKVGGQVVNLVYPASNDQATVSATLQTEVRQILTAAGMSVSNSQVLRVREEENFDFDLGEFSRKYKINSLKTYNILKYLEKENYWEE